MKPLWKDGFEFRDEHALGAESPWCCLFMALDMDWTWAESRASKGRRRQKQRTKPGGGIFLLLPLSPGKISQRF